MTELTAALGADAGTALIEGEVTAGACYAIDGEVIRVQGPDFGADYWPPRRNDDSWVIDRAIGGVAAEHAEGAELTAVVPSWGTSPVSSGGSSVTIGPGDPGALGAGALWLQTEVNGNFVQLHCRAADDSAWVAVTPIYHSGALQSIDSPDGATELIVSSSGEQSGWATDGTLSFRRYGPNVRFVIDGDGYHMADLPSSDPAIAGVLWNDSGTLKVSAGPPP